MISINSNNLTFENLHYEYKSAKGGLPKSFWESYSAFANSDGGFIYLGVDETKRHIYTPVGLTEEEVQNLKTIIFTSANNIQKVSTNLLNDSDVEEILIDGFLALRVCIKRCPNELRPVYINSNVYQGTYRRNADGDFHCAVEEVNAMIRDSSAKPQDLKCVEDLDYTSLSGKTIKAYKQMFASLHPAHPFLLESDEKFLEFIGAVRINKEGRYCPTYAGLLMFGLSYRIVYEFPNYFLDYREIDKEENERWINRFSSDSGEWSGNIFDFFMYVTQELTKNIAMPFMQDKNATRIDDNNFKKAIREALCNTLCNADYHLSTGILITKYEQKIIFENPGALNMDISQMLKGGISNPRNKTILKMFNLINIGERSGSGVPLIVSTSKENKLPLPIVEEEYHPDCTRLTLFTANEQKYQNNNLSNLEKDIIQYLKNNDRSSAKEISEYLNKNITTIKLTLYKLVDLKLVKSEGTIKNKRYFI